jgi:hypothetical protein
MTHHSLAADELKYIEMLKVKKLADSNNVIVTFFGRPSVLIGKKQLVLLLDKIARNLEPHNYPGTHETVASNAAECRRRLWPKSLI